MLRFAMTLDDAALSMADGLRRRFGLPSSPVFARQK